MNDADKVMIKSWLILHDNNAESVACWMRDVLKIGSIKSCRELIKQAVLAKNEGKK